MKLAFYNIAFGTGLNGSWTQYINKVWRFFWTSKKALNNIAGTLKKIDADVVCLAEIDNGSFRNGFKCQTTNLANKLHYKFFDSQNKFHPHSIWNHLILSKNQHDGVLSKKEGVLKRHHLQSGMQKLVCEFLVDEVSIFIVHLAVLSRRVRANQLIELTGILNKCKRPYVVCGDFNIHKGLHEIEDFIKKTNTNLVQTPMTFPSHKPNRIIDLFLTSPELKVEASGVLNVHDSDHLPIWIELKKR